MATVTPPKLNVDEFLKLDLGEGQHELVRGEIVMSPPAEYGHGYVCLRIAILLDGYGRRTGHGHAATNDAAVFIDDATLRGADVAYYGEARWPRSRAGRERPPVPPDLVVEVLSPSERSGAVLEKVADYLRAGLLMVWLVDPRRRFLTIYRAEDPTPTVLAEGDRLADLPELPGFACGVAEFFA